MKKQFIAAAALALATTASAQVYVADNGNLIAPMEGSSTDGLVVWFDDDNQCNPVITTSDMVGARQATTFESSTEAYRVDKNDIHTFVSQVRVVNKGRYARQYATWDYDTAGIIEEMKAGQTLRGRFTNTDGNFVYTVYHLNGFTAAYAQAEALCTPSDTAGFFE